MSDGYLDIIFFAMVAAFIAFRLRSVLGRRTGHERRPTDPAARQPPAARADNVVPLPERQQPANQGEDRTIADVGDNALKAGLTQIRLTDPSFDLDQFLAGAKAAFGMVVEGFAKGDKAALRPLLADDVYGKFAQAIDERERAGHTLTTELVALRQAEIVAASMQGSRARLRVKITSEQINLTRDAHGVAVDGDPHAIAEVVDLWSFERDTRLRDPNWALVETGSAA